MARAQFQVLVIPFRETVGGKHEFAIFKRADGGYWQFIAGGGEDNESPADAAKREAEEEAGLPQSASCYALKTTTSIPAYNFAAGFRGRP